MFGMQRGDAGRDVGAEEMGVVDRRKQAVDVSAAIQGVAGYCEYVSIVEAAL
jgi:hypothetical protein